MPDVLFSKIDKTNIIFNFFAISENSSVVGPGIFSERLKWECFSVWQKYFVKNNSMSFQKAYQKTASLVNLAEKKKKKLNELSLEDFKKIEPTLTIDVLKVFDLKNSVNSKKSYGGTSFDNIKKMIRKYRKLRWLKK